MFLSSKSFQTNEKGSASDIFANLSIIIRNVKMTQYYETIGPPILDEDLTLPKPMETLNPHPGG